MNTCWVLVLVSGEGKDDCYDKKNEIPNLQISLLICLNNSPLEWIK